MRLTPPQSEAVRLRQMASCLDLRKMSTDLNYASADRAKAPLQQLYRWLESRLANRTPDEAALIDRYAMPPFETVWLQFELLAQRLRTLALDHSQPFRFRWRNAHSGTVIMKDVFTSEKLYVDVDAYLYIFQHCACKTMCEAVIEGMGGVWDKCAKPERHLSFEESAREAVLAWSAPQPWHPEAVPFINHSLNEVFGFYSDGHMKGKPKPWNFTHVDQRTSRLTATPGQVIARLRNDRPRLPSAAYNRLGRDS